MKNVYIFILMLYLMVSCGTDNISVLKDNPTNPNGEGYSSPSPVITTLDVPTKGTCIEVIEDEIWVENEGHHMDIYNNEDCDHGPDPKEVLCNNVHIGEVDCETGGYRYYIEYNYTDMVLYKLELRDEMAIRNSMVHLLYGLLVYFSQ